eukprot:m.341593 g.341593  ORF g.341593 m.341593 type:complete len:147 (-) comp20248_c0_seq1:2095-2535(-)
MVLWRQFLGLGGDVIAAILAPATLLTVLLGGLKLDGVMEKTSWWVVLIPVLVGLGSVYYFYIAVIVRGLLCAQWKAKDRYELRSRIIWPVFVTSMVLTSVLLFGRWLEQQETSSSTMSLGSVFAPLWTMSFWALLGPDPQRIKKRR